MCVTTRVVSCVHVIGNKLEFTDEERETIRVERLEKQPPTGWSEISEMLSNETSTRPPGMIKTK